VSAARIYSAISPDEPTFCRWLDRALDALLDNEGDLGAATEDVARMLEEGVDHECGDEWETVAERIIGEAIEWANEGRPTDT
jgi:hypothetical protein